MSCAVQTNNSKAVKNARRGSDPRAATCRGKLQSKRSKLNMEINKELMLRSGAENLFKATTNKKMKETVALELSFVNSNLQLLKEQLAELNSSVEVYQASSQLLVPMIPLGLKETKEIELQEPFKDFILEHYSEDGGEYEESLAELQDLRQAMRTPTRDQHGTALLFQYYNHLYYIERRFFPPDRSLGIYFEWYDSLTGVPSCQRTVAFEKASVLFNIGGLYTQIGTKQDRGTAEGLDAAVDNFLRAAGTFQYIHENFTNAPSMDLGPETLQMLVQLMCGQARECLFEKSRLGDKYGDDDDRVIVEEDESEEDAEEEERDIDHCLELGQEAAYVGEVYDKVFQAISQQQVKDYVPFSWVSLIQVKREHYKALAHYYVAIGLLDHQGDLSEKTRDTLQFLHDIKEGKHNVPRNKQERKYLGKAHLREALLLHEEALRVNRMCRELRKKDQLAEVLRHSHHTSIDKYADIDEEDDFQEVMDPPPVLPSTTYQLTLSYPDFSHHRVTDLFRSLGPVAVFSAKHHWSAPRTIQLRKKDEEGYGFSVRGDAPVIVAGVETSSLAHIGGMKEGDYLVGIGEEDVKWSSHSEVVASIKAAGNSLKLRLVTPSLRSSCRSNINNNKNKLGGMSPTSTTSSSSGLSSAGSSFPGDLGGHSPPLSESGSTRGLPKLPFSIFKKGKERKLYRDDFLEENVSFR